MPKPGLDSPCSIARTLSVVGERWTFLILRDAFIGVTRFADFRASLGIAPDVLADRLARLVEHGVLARGDYQEPGRRVRQEYRLTPAGQDLKVVMAGLQQWGDQYLPRAGGRPCCGAATAMGARCTSASSTTATGPSPTPRRT
jgi:DNA-binding HxlR family transcriptional regulator